LQSRRYTLKEANGVTEFIVDMDTTEEYKNMFEEMRPKALKKTKRNLRELI
jgi:hypothetical protein